MSLLPQRKKSVEEIAQLRETLGIPVIAQEPPAGQEVVDKIVPSTHQAGLVHPEQTVRIGHPPEEQRSQGAHPVHSFKRSEKIAPPSAPVPAAVIPDPPPAAQSPKRVRSLRKSEQAPASPPEKSRHSHESPLPLHRRSDQELAEIRRREALAILNSSATPKITHAHPVLLAPGYLASVIGAIGFYYYEFHMAITAGCVVLALFIATIIFIRNPYSRHHAAFITVIAVFIAVFASLHYFPQLTLQHGP
jgi:hypothetical protein